MATFNGARHLDEQLSDLAEQSVLPAELVVCDDGSTDGTLQILERFAADAPFPVHIRRNGKQLGYRANFIKCAGLCRSDLIAFCDQDDRWLPNKLATMRKVFDDPEILLAFHPVQVFDDKNPNLGRLTPSEWAIGDTPALSGSPWVFSLGFTQMFRRWLCDFDRWWELSHDQNTADDRLAHDQWYFFLAATLGTITQMEMVLARYRQHHENVFGWGGPRPSKSKLVRLRVGWARSGLARRARSALNRAEILELATETLKAPYKERALNGAIAYRQLGTRCALRAKIHGAKHLSERLRSFARLITNGGYGSGAWKAGPKAFMMDILVGLPGANREPGSVEAIPGNSGT
jgi:glycosyltransferase involved in cell wall biosynthesis